MASKKCGEVINNRTGDEIQPALDLKVLAPVKIQLAGCLVQLAPNLVQLARTRTKMTPSVVHVAIPDEPRSCYLRLMSSCDSPGIESGMGRHNSAVDANGRKCSLFCIVPMMIGSCNTVKTVWDRLCCRCID